MTTPTSRRIGLDTGLTLHVLEWQPQKSCEHTVVLVHGFLDSAWGWQPMMQTGLLSHLHVLAPDMRGHGDSDWVGAGGYYHFLDYLADLRSLLARLGRTRISLVGHSMGGTICGYYAGAFADEIYKLALLEGLGPPQTQTPVPERVRNWTDGWRRARTAASRTYPSLDDAAARLRHHDPLLDAELARWIAEKSTVADTTGFRFKHDPLHLTRGPYPFRLDVAQEFWQRVRCPVLLIDAEKSFVRTADDEMRRRAANFKAPEHALLANAAHMMQRHQPRALAERLTTFLTDD